MIRRTKAWLAAAVIFGLGNVAGAVMAAIGKEAIHAAAHIVLALLSAYVARAMILAQRPVAAASVGISAGEAEARLAHLELSLGGLASGVERMREGNHSIEQILAERRVGSELRDDAGRE